MNAMILAAGLGTRLKPFTDHHPKALATVKGKPVLQRNIEWLQQFGIYDVIVNVHHFADQVTDAIQNAGGWGSKITISDERDEILETGGGIKKASWFLASQENSLIMNADILTDLPLDQMIAFHLQHKPLATLATTGRETSRYLLFDENGSMQGWKNIKTGVLKGMPGKQAAFSGIQIVSREIFNQLTLEGKFSMIDAYLSLCRQNPILSFDHSNSKLVDIGTMEKLRLAEDMFP